jgi:DNA sulfur modification protein DndB
MNVGILRDPEELDSSNYSFPAIRGIQAGREYYSAMVQLKLIPTIFRYNEAEVPAEFRSQRTLNRARIPEIARYIVNNSEDYVFSSIAASISDGPVKFRPVDEKNESRSKIGKLVLSTDVKIIINDGQHRRAAIEEALKVRPDLGNEHISVVFYIDKGLKRSQQMFSDLNRHAVRPTKSINILYDGRDPFAKFIFNMAESILLFKGFTDLERTSISNRSRKMFTLSIIYQATQALLSKKTKVKKVSPDEEKLAFAYWNEVAKNIPEWQQMINNDIKSYILREEYVHAHGIALHALGVVGNSLLREYPDRWEGKLTRLQEINWLRSNTAVWEGRAMNHGRISKSQTNLVLTTNYLKQKMNLSLTPFEEEMEKQFAIHKPE